MPTASEKVINRPLSGTEAKGILREAFERLLGNEGLLSPHIAYGRFAYTISLGLHLDNPVAPESLSRIDSRAPAVNETDPSLAVVEAPPLADPSPESLIVGSSLDGKVESPNEERLRLGLPIPVDVREQDGTMITKMVEYPPQPDIGTGNVKLRDSTLEQTEKWKGKKG